jgi:hypothetical protein
MNRARCAGVWIAAGLWLATVAPACLAEPQDVKFSVVLYGESRDQVDVVVDTHGLGDSVILQASFIARFKDASGKQLGRTTYSFIDGQLGSMVANHVYRRRYYHPWQSPGAVSTNGLSISFNAPGTKSDGGDFTIASSRFSPPSADVSLSQPKPVNRENIHTMQAVYVANNPRRSECHAYAKAAVEQFNRYVTKQCGAADSRWNAGFARHFEWCRHVTPDMSASENSERSKVLRQCGH